MKLFGHVERGLTPCIRLKKNNHTAHLTIDTGFEGDLCLDHKTLMKWKFEPKGTQEVELADGSIVASRIYVGTIVWFGRQRRVLSHATSSKECLLGAGLLYDVEVMMHLKKGLVRLRLTSIDHKRWGRK